MNHPSFARIRLDPAHFARTEAWLLRSRGLAVSTFRYGSGVEVARIRCGRGEITWLPFLGQQLWDWKIDGASLKFTGFVEEPAYGRDFLQNYGAFLVHCGMTAMGNPGPSDTHPQHGEMSTAKIDCAWLELRTEDRGGSVSLCGSLHWHVPYQCNYRCVIRATPDQTGEAVRVALAVRNESRTPMEMMYLAHINWSLSDAVMIRGARGLSDGFLRMRNESANPAARQQLRAGTLDPSSVQADPEFVATIDDGAATSPDAESRLVRRDGSSFWVRHRKGLLDHHVIWITGTPDRGACGFHLPSTSGPDGLAAERAAGDVKVLGPGEIARMAYSFGYNDAQSI